METKAVRQVVPRHLIQMHLAAKVYEWKKQGERYAYRARQEQDLMNYKLSKYDEGEPIVFYTDYDFEDGEDIVVDYWSDGRITVSRHLAD